MQTPKAVAVALDRRAIYGWGETLLFSLFLRSTLNGRCWRFYAFDAAAVEIGYRNGWIERGDKLTIAIAYNNQLSALEYSSRVDLRLFFRKKIVSNPHTQDGIRSVPFVLDVLHTQLWSIPLIATK